MRLRRAGLQRLVASPASGGASWDLGPQPPLRVNEATNFWRTLSRFLVRSFKLSHYRRGVTQFFGRGWHRHGKFSPGADRHPLSTRSRDESASIFANTNTKQVEAAIHKSAGTVKGQGPARFIRPVGEDQCRREDRTTPFTSLPIGLQQPGGHRQVVKRALLSRERHRSGTRLTNAFSRKIENHSAAVALYYFAYNFSAPNPWLECGARARGAERWRSRREERST